MTEKQLREKLEVWKKRLGLQEWWVVLEIGGVSDKTSYMEVQRSPHYRRGKISVSPWLLGLSGTPEDVMIQGDNLTDKFIEECLVHELLHLHTRTMAAVVRDDLENQLHRDVYYQVGQAHDRAEEQCVDELAIALVRAFSNGAT